MRVKSSEEIRKLKKIIKKDMDSGENIPKKKLRKMLDSFFKN